MFIKSEASLTARPLRQQLITDTLVLALLVILSLAITWPWIQHPLATTIGNFDDPRQLETADIMMSMSFGGWLRFALLELGQWPLAHTPYLMFPAGAAHGTSFDSLLHGMVVGALNIFMPLALAYSVSVLLAFILSGWVCYRYGVWLWGRGGLAVGVGVTAEFASYIFQRSMCHPNLMFVWTLPLAMMTYQRWRANPLKWRCWGAWVFSFPLLALSSWYILLTGLVFQVSSAFAFLACNARRLLAQPLRSTTYRLLGGWLAGGLLIGLIAWPMLSHSQERAPIPLATMAQYSVPLVQYLMPNPHGYFGQTAWARKLQGRMGTEWEAVTGVPILCLILLLAYLLSRKRPGEERLALGLTAFGVGIFTLGPYLQLGHALPPGQGLRMPVYYLYGLSSSISVFKCPGRMHILFFYVALMGAGQVLNGLRGRLRSPRPLKKALWPLLVIGFTVLNVAWLGRLGNSGVFPTPQVPLFYRELGKHKGTGAIMDVPIDYYATSIYDYYQLWHKRPAVSSVLYHDGIEKASQDFVWTDWRMLFFLGSNKDFPLAENLAAVKHPDYFRKLASAGVDYLVIHPKTLQGFITTGIAHPQTADYYRQLEEALQERLIYRDELIAVYGTGLLPPKASRAK